VTDSPSPQNEQGEFDERAKIEHKHLRLQLFMAAPAYNLQPWSLRFSEIATGEIVSLFV